MKPQEIKVARDFSRYPAGRYESDGPYSGQIFRKNVLAPALRGNADVVVDLDGTLGYGSSFFEEAFGGLVRSDGFSADDLRARLTIVSEDSSWEQEVWSYIDDAESESAPPSTGSPTHP